MFHGVVLSGWFDGEAVPPDIDLAHERFDLSTESFSMHFDPGFPCEFASSVTLTVPIEHPSPSADVFVVSPCGTWTEPKADTFFLAGKASLSATEKAGLSGAASESRVAAASEEPFALRAQAMADGGTREIGPQITRLPTRGLTEREAERALSDDLQLTRKFSKFFSRGADYQVAASRLGIEESTTTSSGEWREINRLILENPEAVIRTTLGPSVVRGYIGTVEDVRLITFVYERTGLYASTTIPYPSQLLTAGLI